MKIVAETGCLCSLHLQYFDKTEEMTYTLAFSISLNKIMPGRQERSQDRKLPAARRFLGTFGHEIAQGMNVNQTVRERVVFELGKQGNDIDRPELSADWDAFEKILFRFRPRLISAISAYSLLSGKNFEDIKRQQGMLPSKAFWMLGSIQDNLLDGLDKERLAEMSEQDRFTTLYGAIFGQGREFQQATHSAIVDEIETNSVYGVAEVEYLHGRMEEWFDFLLHQESDAYERPEEDYTFAFCKDYREKQNAVAGRVVVAFLNGKDCLDPELQQLETTVPYLSYRTQIIDDIGDIAEDIELRRPSFMVGALRDNPDELERIKEVIKRKNIRKFTPHKVKKYAPKSYEVVKEAYVQYGEAITQRHGGRGEVLDRAGRIAFHTFPVMRDVMYGVNERYSYF
ncbi:MAG TPA: hypothetical protein VLG12_05180 [Candidatus Saccharimonadales bacterium]|nr:hypothetical protein [Candidatus Saccharimonadales bacterium]